MTTLASRSPSFPDALRDLDGPHFAVLGRMKVAGQDQDAVRKVADAAPDPVVAALIRHAL